MQRMLKFSSAKIPKLSKANLVSTKVHLLIQHINQLLRQEAFDDSVLGNLIDKETIWCQRIEDMETHPSKVIALCWDVSPYLRFVDTIRQCSVDNRS
jgi:hypothetical protein